MIIEVTAELIHNNLIKDIKRLQKLGEMKSEKERARAFKRMHERTKARLTYICAWIEVVKDQEEMKINRNQNRKEK